jgi:hypothetical protein
MAKNQKFSEDLLLTAVIMYSEIEHGKIKMTELAEWSRKNVPGLEDVQNYHFTRPIREKDPQTGKVKEHAKACSLRIDDINKSRQMAIKVKTNILLSSSNIDQFYELPKSVQRDLIFTTRQDFNLLLAKNANLRKNNDTLRFENNELCGKVEHIANVLDKTTKEIEVLSKQINYLMKEVDEEKQRETLRKMGIDNGKFTIKTYMESLKENVGNILNINNAIRAYQRESENDNKEANAQKNDITDDILSGLLD